MNWLRSLGTLEYIFIGCFLLFYILYIIRIFLIARKLKSRMRSIFYKFILRSFYFFLLLFALLGPSFGNIKKEIKSISKEIYLIADLSLSMNANDIEPSRLAKSKEVMKKMTDAFSSDKIGLIGFSSSARVICPSTFDRSAMHLFIESLDTELMGAEGSDLSTGISLSTKQFQNSSLHLKKIAILITDGEDFGEKTEQAIFQLKDQEITLIVVGIGTESGSSIPFNGVYKKDKQGKIVISKLQSQELMKTAELADGAYFEINTLKNETESLINYVNSIEGTVSETREVDASANKYLYFLVFALFLIIMDVLITIRTVKI